MPRRLTPLSSVIRPSRSWLDRCGCWLIDRRAMAEFLDVPVQKISNLHASGRIPLPIRFTFGPSRYCVPELRDWLRMGCPRIGEWIDLRGISGNRLTYMWGREVRQFAGEEPRPVGPAVEVRE